MLLQFFKTNWMPLTLGGLALLAVAIIIFVPRHQAMTARRSMSEVIQKLPDEKRGEEWLKAEKEIAAIGNSARTTLAQILGGIVLLIGLYFTYQNAKTAQATLRVTEDGKITDRFSKAVELLGSDKVDLRLGGIYALERIARDSKHDHWTIMEILTAYIRLRSPQIDGNNDATTDIQAALDVIGRRKWTDSEKPSQRINLSWTNLSRTMPKTANFSNATLIGADFSNSDFLNTDFSNADFLMASFKLATLTGVNLSGADFTEANLSRAKLDKVVFNNVTFTDAFLLATELKGADLSKAKNLTWEQIKTAIIDEETILPPDLEAIRQAEQQNKTSES